MTFEIANVDYSPPPAPQNLHASAGIGRVTLTWSAAVGTLSYAISRGRTENGPFTPLGDVSTTNFVDTAGSGGTTYFYEVAAINGAGTGPNSLPVAATPATPPQLSAGLADTNGPLRITWPGWATNFTLLASTNLTSKATWLPVTNAVVGTNGGWRVELPLNSRAARFFRLLAP